MGLKKFICIEDHWIPGFEAKQEVGDETYFIKRGTILEATSYSDIFKIPLYQLDRWEGYPNSVILDDPKYYECAYRHIRNAKIDEILNC